MLECLLLAAFAITFSPIDLYSNEAYLVLPQDEKQEKKADKDKPPEYPKLSPLHKEKCKRLFRSFKNRNASKRRSFEKDMIKLGRGAIPDLLKNAKTKHENQGECIYNCLVALMDKTDLVTLKKSCYESDCPRLKLLAVVKIASFAMPEQRSFLKFAAKSDDPQIKLEAALGLVAIQDPSAIGEIILKVSENRRNPSKRLLKDLPKLSGKTYASMFSPYLVRHKDPEVRISAITVILAINDKKLKQALGKALNDPHNLVKTAAVNGLRKLVNNQGPKEFSNVFVLVEAVNKWKKDLGMTH